MSNRLEFGFNQYSSPAAETSLQILLSDDETLGVAFLRTDESSQVRIEVLHCSTIANKFIPTPMGTLSTDIGERGSREIGYF